MHITNKHMLACVCAEKVYTDSVNAWMHDVKSTHSTSRILPSNKQSTSAVHIFSSYIYIINFLKKLLYL